ncbi:hypothetical protein BDQ12DRAFT_153473 [Crucibulum laeve]|uniref:Uncharacterized protein n=1 Tax=Crucibulum laeve TaxID=68775 RepID=A0A5C3LEV9_9AGAR|nr:hypothetical protein BDQ12DRAFT_153473 [Crucibulum laeve]
MFGGIYLVVFPLCIFLTRKGWTGSQRNHWIIISAMTLQFILSTIFAVIQIIRGFQTFVDSSGLQLASLLYWSHAAQPLEAIEDISCFTSVLIGDAIILWRLHVVWEQNLFVCILPSVCLFASGVCGYVVNGLFSGSFIYKGSAVFPAILWGVSLAIQLFSSVLISWRIYSIGISPQTKKGLMSEGCAHLQAIVWIIVESGTIYTCTLIAVIILYGLNMQSAALIMGGAVHLCGMLPALTVARVGFRRWKESDQWVKRPMTLSALVFASAESRRTQLNNSLSVAEQA